MWYHFNIVTLNVERYHFLRGVKHMECTKIFSLWDSGRKNQLQIIAVREFEACPIFILIPWERIMNTDISKSFHFLSISSLVIRNVTDALFHNPTQNRPQRTTESEDSAQSPKVCDRCISRCSHTLYISPYDNTDYLPRGINILWNSHYYDRFLLTLLD